MPVKSRRKPATHFYVRVGDVIWRIGLCLMAFATLFAVAFRLQMGDQFVFALLSAFAFLLMKRVYDLWIEARLRFSIGNVPGGSSTHVTGTRDHSSMEDSFQILVRNPTGVPINVREIRLVFSSRPGQGETFVRLWRLGDTYHVFNRDAASEDSELDPTILGPPELAIGEHRYAHVQPRDFHEIPPQCAAIYGFWDFGMRSRIGESVVVDCIIFADYPTIFGRRKVVRVHASRASVSMIERTIAGFMHPDTSSVRDKD